MCNKSIEGVEPSETFGGLHGRKENMYEYLQIGEIINTHGVKGELKIMPLTDDPYRFDALEQVYVDRKVSLDRRRIQSVKYVKSMVVLKLEGIDTVEDAEALRGLFLVVDRKDAVKLPEDSFFICDILGADVQDLSGASLGKLADVIQTGSNDVYVVKNSEGREILLPALKSVVREISVDTGVIKVEIPEGLLQDEV